jgi:hypothetical protein
VDRIEGIIGERVVAFGPFVFTRPESVSFVLHKAYVPSPLGSGGHRAIPMEPDLPPGSAFDVPASAYEAEDNLIRRYNIQAGQVRADY